MAEVEEAIEVKEVNEETLEEDAELEVVEEEDANWVPNTPQQSRGPVTSIINSGTKPGRVLIDIPVQ